MYPILTLKPGKEGALGFHHPWVFSGALQGIPREIEQGAVVQGCGPVKARSSAPAPIRHIR